MTVSAEGRVENQKLWLSFWFSTRFTRKKFCHSRGTYLYPVLHIYERISKIQKTSKFRPVIFMAVKIPQITLSHLFFFGALNLLGRHIISQSVHDQLKA